MIAVEHKAQSQASREEVWARIADLEGWDKWGPWTETTLDGEIRSLVSERKRINGQPYVMKERVTAMVPNERFEYDLLSGLPVKNYHAVVRLHDLPGGGTEIYWRSTFDSPWPGLGFLWRGAMQKVIRDVAEALAQT